MRTLNECLIESLLDDEDELVNDNTTLIEQFLNDNYIIKGTYTIKNGIVDVDGDVRISWDVHNDITGLTNDIFEFGTINGDFIINDCINLKTLNGGPKRVKGDFLCSYCEKLESFEYAPKYVGQNLGADYCSNLKSLKGLPKKVESISLVACKIITNLEHIPDANEYILDGCSNLKSLEGLPASHEYSLSVSNCKKLKSLKGCGRKIGYLDIIKCSLNSFKDGPEILSGNLYMDYTEIKSLDGFPKIIKGDINLYDATLPISFDEFKNEFIPQNVKLSGDITT